MYLSSQAQIDAFECKTIERDLEVRIAGGSVQSLEGLMGLRSVGGSVVIRNNEALQSLKGLDSLASVGGDLEVEDNRSLSSLSGLDALTTVVGGIQIRNVPIESLEGLGALKEALDLRLQSLPITSTQGVESLTRLNRSLSVSNCRSLPSLDGFDALTYVSDLEVLYNDALKSLSGLGGLTEITGSIQIVDNVLLSSIEELPRPVTISGNLWLRGRALTNLNALSDLESIGGRLALTNVGASDLSMLRSLRTIGEDLVLEGFSLIEEVSDFEALESVGGNLVLSNNAALESVAGLRYATFSGLRVEENPVLESLDGLNGLAEFAESVSIVDNASLQSLDGLGEVRSILRGLRIEGNAALESLGAFSDLRFVAGASIQENPSLAHIDGFNDLIRLVGNLSIRSNRSLEAIDGFRSIRRIEGSLFVQDNYALSRLAGLDTLSRVNGDLFLIANRSLANIDGLRSLISVGKSVIVLEAGLLADLDALHSLRQVTESLSVVGNASLESCGCGLAKLISNGTFSGVGVGVAINSNAPGGQCASPQVVLEAGCPSPTSTPEDELLTLALEVAPNPAVGPVRVAWMLPESGPATVAVFDMLGRQVSVVADGDFTAGRHSAVLEGVAPGRYVIRIEAGGAVYSKALSIVR